MKLGRRQVVKAPGFDPGIRRFESSRPSQHYSLYVTMNDRKLMIFGGNANPVLTQNIAAYLQQPIGKATMVRFSDGETSVEILENVRGGDVFIVQPTCNPQR